MNHRLGYFFISIALIVFLWIKLTMDLNNYLDIFFFDEAFYMSRGIYPSQLIGNAENGPLYSLWYTILHLFERDKVLLYFLNWKIMVLLPTLSLFFVLACYNVTPFIALGLSIAFMWADATFLQWPRVSNFCISLIAIGLGIANYKKNIYYKFFVIISTALIASYIRPEYFMSFLFLISCFIIYIVFNYKDSSLKMRIAFMCLLFVVLLLKFFYQLPMFEENSYRSFIAFAQYFAVYYFAKNNILLDPWTQWEHCFRQNFGNANSMSTAIINNPNAFLEMLNFNLVFFIKKFYLFLPEFIYPKRIFNLHLVLGVFFLIFSVLYLLIFYLKRYKFSTLFNTLKLYKSTILLIIVFIMPPLIACIVYYPRDHYMFLLVIPLFLICSLLFNGKVLHVSNVSWVNYGLIFLIGILLYSISPSTSQYFPQNSSQPNVSTVKAIRSLNINSNQDINILEEEGGLYAFLDYNFHPASLNSKNENFNSFIMNNQIDIIWVTGNVLNHSAVKEDTYFYNFIQSPELYNFSKMTIANSANYLLISNKLLDK